MNCLNEPLYKLNRIFGRTKQNNKIKKENKTKSSNNKKQSNKKMNVINLHELTHYSKDELSDDDLDSLIDDEIYFGQTTIEETKDDIIINEKENKNLRLKLNTLELLANDDNWTEVLEKCKEYLLEYPNNTHILYCEYEANGMLGNVEKTLSLKKQLKNLIRKKLEYSYEYIIGVVYCKNNINNNKNDNYSIIKQILYDNVINKRIRYDTSQNYYFGQGLFQFGIYLNQNIDNIQLPQNEIYDLSLKSLNKSIYFFSDNNAWELQLFNIKSNFIEVLSDSIVNNQIDKLKSKYNISM